MKDETSKDEKQLASERTELHQRVAESEAAEVKRVQVEETLRRRTAQLEALREVGLELTAQLDLDTLLHSIASRAIELLGAGSGGLYLYRPEQDALEWRVAIGPNLAPTGTVLRRGEGLSGRVWEGGEPLIVGDYQHWEGRPDVYHGYPWTSVMGVPVRWGEEFLGVLNVMADTPHAFSPVDVELLSLFATQAAIAVRNARLYEVERKRVTQLTVVSQVARKAVSILDPDQLLGEIVTEIQQVFDYYNVSLFLPDEAAHELRQHAVAGGLAGVAPSDYRQALGEGMVGWVAETGRSRLANDVSRDPHYISGCLDEAWTASELCVPLKLPAPTILSGPGPAPTSLDGLEGERVIGVLDVQDTRLNAFDETDVVAMETLADQIAVALQNARLYVELRQELADGTRTKEALQRRNHELALLNRAAQVFSSSLDLDQVLITVLGEVRRLLDVVACSAWLIDSETEELVCRQVTDPQSQAVLGWRLMLGQGIAGWVARYGESLIVPDTRTDDRHFKGVDEHVGLEIRSILTVPLRVKQNIIGVIQMGDKEVNRFGTTDLSLVESLASAAAIAIENARLYEDLRASQQYARNIIDSSLDTIIAVDMQRRVVEFNRAARATFGYHPQEILGQHIDTLYDDPQDGLEIHRATVEQGRCVREVLNRRKNGEVFPILLSASALRDVRGELVGVMGVSRDITEQVQAEEQLRASLHEKEVLLKEIHHRVKNNLQLISSLLDLQSSYIQDPRALAVFEESQNRVRSIALIHEQLYQSPNLAQIDWAGHIQHLTSRLFHSYRATSGAVTWEIHVEDVLLDVDTAIPCGLIIHELVSNSLKYAFPSDWPSGQAARLEATDEKRICIEMCEDGDQMTLIVSDNGVGLPPELDFQDAETLGLQLVRMLTQQLRGTIELDRSRGATFKITFPQRG